MNNQALRTDEMKIQAMVWKDRRTQEKYSAAVNINWKGLKWSDCGKRITHPEALNVSIFRSVGLITIST